MLPAIDTLTIDGAAPAAIAVQAACGKSCGVLKPATQAAMAPVDVSAVNVAAYTPAGARVDALLFDATSRSECASGLGQHL